MTSTGEFGKQFSGFYRLSVQERRDVLQRLHPNLDFTVLCGENSLSDDAADAMIENALGSFRLPLGVVPSLMIDGISRTIPMITEEASVVAAANKAAKCFNASGGVHCKIDEPYLSGHVQLILKSKPTDDDFLRYQKQLQKIETELLSLANAQDPTLLAHGGGARRIELKLLAPTASAPNSPYFLVAELQVYTGDAMGANAVNTMLEAIRPTLCEAFDAECGIAIMSNDGAGKLVSATVQLPYSALPTERDFSPQAAAQRLCHAAELAARYPQRAVTHNKGIMNGICALALALGQDTRAIEAAAHFHATKSASYAPLSQWHCEHDSLHGQIQVPLPIGIIGGARQKHPAIAAAYALLACNDYATCAASLAAIGLAQNFAALWALATYGIQQGHMRLHSRAT
ncbi:MAG: hydroxymethylglutaryl-CoA reductase, degradative [Bradymonadales bacterium]|jgi:hydroxymethylglutaryl-CoA reductase